MARIQLPKILLIDANGASQQYELGSDTELPPAFKWAEAACKKFTEEFAQLRLRMPELWKAFEHEDGAVAITQGNVDQWLKYTKEKDKKPEDHTGTVAMATTGFKDLKRYSMLVFNSQHYMVQNDQQNILAHELAHKGDLFINKDWKTTQLKIPHHSENKLFQLCYNLDHDIRLKSSSKLIDKKIKSAGYSPEEFWSERFANSVGHFVATGGALRDDAYRSPLVQNYLRNVFKYDLELKLEGEDAYRARARLHEQLNPMVKSEVYVGNVIGRENPELLNRLNQWQLTRDKVERCEAAEQDLRSVIEKLMKRDATIDPDKEIGVKLGQYMEEIKFSNEALRDR